MRNLTIKNDIKEVLPVQIEVSFAALYNFFLKYASIDKKKHPFHLGAIRIKKEMDDHPFLIEGFSDLSLLEKHKEIIDIMLKPLFPEILEDNEIKAAMIPFYFKNIKLSSRFQNILKNAGPEFDLKVRNFDADLMYRRICAIILQMNYGYKIDMVRPFYFDIPNVNTGIIHHYRGGFNGDFIKIIATEAAPKITEEDYKELLNNFDDIQLWKEKFPPNSYVLKGFGLMNLFDVTTDQSITEISSELLNAGEDISDRIEAKMRDFFRIKDLRIGFSTYDVSANNIYNFSVKKHESFILNDEKVLSCNGFFCNHITDNIFNKNEAISISDVEAYGRGTNKNGFYKQLVKHDIKSLIIVPFRPNNGENLVLLEIMSYRAYELNSATQSKLDDILPIFKTAVERFNVENKNAIEAIIQDKYTSIHPAVKWRFDEAAEKYQQEFLAEKEDIKIEEIVFKEVYPLYGQSDIKGSSLARNKAIKEDLITQLSLAITVLEKVLVIEKKTIYKDLLYRLNGDLIRVKEGMNSGDETLILSFLKEEVFSVFKDVKELNEEVNQLVLIYINRLDPVLQVVYEKRKEYETSVTILNDSLSRFIDKKQKEAQVMFPHYFERYKTDGVDYNMYIGQSLVKNKTYNDTYLHNLQLWQLGLMCEMENVAIHAAEKMENKLRIASLILVHSTPLAIKFRMDEKQFDVDGAYNIRYEIIKKRLDKVHIKGTKNRLTVPDKIAIVYAQENDALIYKKYIKYLQSKNKFGIIEELELEDLEGVSGLKALRVEVIYHHNFCEKSSLPFKELIAGFQ